LSIPNWSQSLKTFIIIFNVERGLSIFIRTPLNQGIIYDFGSSNNFIPTDFIVKRILPFLHKYRRHKIGQSIISHPHADHINNIACLTTPSKEESPLKPFLLTCPNDKTKSECINWNRIKNPEGSEKLIAIYKNLYEERNPPLQTIRYESSIMVPNVEYGIFYIRPPIVNNLLDDDQRYANGISLVVFYRHGYHTILIPGDIDPEIMKLILNENEGLEKRYTIFDRNQADVHPNWHIKTEDQPSLKSLLNNHGLSVLVAPHHGLESGFSDDLYNSIKSNKPGIVAISEKKHLTEKDGKINSRYQSEDGAKGQHVYIEGKKEFRYSISTRQGHHILITFSGTGGLPEIYLEKDINSLIDYIT